MEAELGEVQKMTRCSQYNGLDNGLAKSAAVVLALRTVIWINPGITASAIRPIPPGRRNRVKSPSTFVRIIVSNHWFTIFGSLLSVRQSKRRTLADLHDAIEDADGKLKLKLRNQFLAEKKVIFGIEFKEEQASQQKSKYQASFV